MNYRSIADLAAIIRSRLFVIPPEVDLIVGIPRSGLLAANILALQLNIKSTDLQGYLRDIPIESGQTRTTKYPNILAPSDARFVLFVDDSINSGTSMREVKERVKEYRHQVLYFAAIYSSKAATRDIDFYFEYLKPPRLFEWNLMHRPFLDRCCVDIDGVLCVDPTDKQNDDGDEYNYFLRSASPLATPTYPVGHLVTSRLEKYRYATEAWLTERGILYKQLHMLDLPNAKVRRELRSHGSFKGKVYASLADTELFIESEPLQAIEIAKQSGKLVLCYSDQKIYYPDMSYIRLKVVTKSLTINTTRKVLNLLKSSFS